MSISIYPNIGENNQGGGLVEPVELEGLSSRQDGVMENEERARLDKEERKRRTETVRRRTDRGSKRRRRRPGGGWQAGGRGQGRDSRLLGTKIRGILPAENDISRVLSSSAYSPLLLIASSLSELRPGFQVLGMESSVTAATAPRNPLPLSWPSLRLLVVVSPTVTATVPAPNKGRQTRRARERGTRSK